VDYKYIVIEGNIGAGKTSLAKKIAAEYNANLVLEEFEDNPFLPKFYKNPDKYSFHVELSFLASRYQQLINEIPYKNLFKTFTLADFYFSKSLIFASVTLSQSEFNLYRKIFNIIYKSLPKPDIYVYLHVNSEKLLENIKKRGRDYELDLDEAYLNELQNAYFQFMREQKEMRIVVLDVTNMDFIKYSSDYKAIKEHIFNKEYNKGLNQIAF
jgi:deoxyadenosine/deoxycytidine kinase